MSTEIEAVLDRLRDRPNDAEVLRALGDLLADQQQLSPEQESLLERSREQLQRSGAWPTLVGLIDLELPRTHDVERRAALLSLKGRLLQRELLDQTAALEAFEQVLQLQPEDEDTRRELDEINLVRENWQRVASKYVEEAEAASERELATNLFVSAAEVVARNGGDPAQVEQYLRRALEADPRNGRAAAHLERLLRRLERYGELAELLDQRCAVAESQQERTAAFIAAGELWHDELGEPDRAAEYYRKVLALEPANPRALQALVALLTDKEDWASLVRVYAEAQRALPADQQQPDALVQIGLLYARKLDQPRRAEEYFRRVRKLDPTQEAMLEFYRERYREKKPGKLLALLDAAQREQRDPARRLALVREMADVAERGVGNPDKAIDIWKSLLRAEPQSAEAIASLKRLYREASPPKWNALRELLKEEVDALGDDRVDEKIARLLEIVEIYRDHLKLDVMVVNTYNAILELKPDHAEALAALVERYELMGRWNDLIGALRRRVQHEQDPRERIETLHRIASLWVDKFGNHSQAIAPLEEILALDPLEQRALSALRAIHERRRNWRGVVDLLRAEADHREGERRRQLLEEMGQLATARLGDPGEAIEVYNALLADDPRDRRALEALAELYRKTKRWPALAEVSHRLRQSASDDFERFARLTGQLAELHADRLDDVEGAVQLWRELLELHPDHDDGVHQLHRLLLRDGRWDELERLLGERGQWGELSTALIASADRSRSPEVKLDLYQRVGRIAQQWLDDPDRAIKAYERALAVDSSNPDVCRALVPLYRATARWSRLLLAYETLLESTESHEVKLELLEAIRGLCEQKLGAKQLAFQWCARAYRLAPEDPTIQGEITRLAGEAKQWEELLDVLKQRCEELDDEQARAALLRRMAGICSHELHRPEDAEQFHLQLLELSPDDPEALVALEEIYQASQRWDALVQIQKRRTDLEQDQEKAIELRYQIAFLQEERLADPVAAIDSYRAILETAAGHRRALAALERLHQTRGEWEAVGETIERQLEVIEEPDRRVELLYRLGHLRDEELGDRTGAISAFEAALELDDNHRPTLLALEQLLEEQGAHRTRVARSLLPFYERSEEYRRIAEVLAVLLEEARDHDDRERELAIVRRLLMLFDKRLEQPERALTFAEQLFSLEPADGDALRALVRLARRTEQPSVLAQSLEQAVAGVGDDAKLELSLSWQLLEVYDEQLGQGERAERVARRILELDPSSIQAVSLLERLLRDAGRWDELRAVLYRRRELSEDADEQRELLAQICALNEDVLGDVQGAIDAYLQILELRPGDQQAVRGLERHYSATERWDELAELYVRQLGLADSDEDRASLQVKQAEVLGGKLGDEHAALDLLEDVVQRSPRHAGAVMLLEEMLVDGGQQRRASEVLETVYQREGSWANLARVLRMRCELIDDVEQRVSLLMRLARLQEEQLEDLSAAFDTYREALLLQPELPESQEAVTRLTDALQRWEQGAACWERALEVAPDEDVALQSVLLSRLAELLRGPLGQSDRAIDAYRRLLALEPLDVETGLLATGALAELYRAAGRSEELVDVLCRRLPWIEQPGERRELLLEAARIEEEVLQRDERAIELYRQLLDEEGGGIEVLDGLERLYVAGQRWQELADVIQRRIDLVETAEQRIELWRRLAELFEQKLDQVDDVVRAHLAILDDSPDDGASLRALVAIYREQRRWPDLLAMIERLLGEAAADGAGDEPAPSSAEDEALEQDERVALLFEAADILDRKIEDRSAALERYRQVLRIQPDHAGAREALEALLEDPEVRIDAATSLGPLYQREERYGDLAAVLELQAAEAAGIERVALLRTIVDLHKEKLEDDRAAFDACRRAVVAAAAQPQLDELVELLYGFAEQLDAWEPFVDSIEQAVVEVLEAPRRQRLHRLAAEQSWQRLGELERARRHYQELLDIDPTDRESLAALEQVLRQSEQWEPLLETVVRRIELAEGDDELLPLLLSAAELCRSELGRPEDAIAYFERARTIDPENEPAIFALDELYDSTARWAELAELLPLRARATEHPQARAGLYNRLAGLYSDQLDDPREALAAYQEVLRCDPDHGEAIETLEQWLEDPELSSGAAQTLEPLYVRRQDWARLIGIYEIRLAGAESDEERLALMTRIAQLYEEQLEELEEAFNWYGKVFVEAPDNASIRDQLLRLTNVLDHWRGLTEVLDQYLDEVVEIDDTARDLLLLSARIFDERLYDWRPARDRLERLLSRDGDDREAFKLLEQLLMRYEQWQELLSLYQRAVDTTLDAARQRELLFNIARVWEEALEDTSQAIEGYRAVLDLETGDVEAMAALERLLHESQRWEELCELIERQVSLADDTEQLIALKLRLGGIFESHLNQLPGAIDFYEEVLTLDPTNRDAIAALERLVLERDQRFRIAQVLEPVYREQDQWAKLVVIYDAQLDFIDDQDRRVYLLCEIARLHEERGGSLELAFKALSRAFEERLGDQSIYEDIERLADQLDAWDKVVELLAGAAEQTYDYDLQARLLSRAAQLQEERLSDPAGAIERWRQVLSVREDDPAAISSLIRLLTEAERYAELVEVLRRRAEVSSDVALQVSTYQRIAEVFDGPLADEVHAIEAWRQVMALEPESEEALGALHRLYTTTERWMELIGIYQRRLDLATDAELWRKLQIELAELYREKLDDRYEAIAAYKALVERDPRDAEVLDALDGLYSLESLWADLLEVLELETELAEDTTERTDLLFRCGNVLASELRDVEGALDRYAQVIELDPAHERTRESLEKLLGDPVHRLRVSELLERVHEHAGDLAALVRVLRSRLEVMSDAFARRDLLVRVAQIQEEGLDNARAAFAAYGEALAEDPGDERLHAELERLADAMEAVDQLAALYQQRVQDVYDDEIAAKLHLKIAMIAEQQLGDDARAEEHYRAALESSGGQDDELLEALDRVLARQEKHDLLIEVLQQRIQAQTDPRRQADFFYRAGELQAREQGDLDAAFSSYREALLRDPDHGGARESMERLLASDIYRVAALDVLEPLYEQADDQAKLIELFEVRLSTLGEPLERTELLRRIAQVQQERLEQPGEALSTLGRALEEDPASGEILSAAEQLADRLGRLAELGALAEEILSRSDVDPDALRELGLSAGRWYRRDLNDPAKAEQIYRRVLEVVPECAEALVALEEIYRGAQQYEQLAETLWRRAELELDAAARRRQLAEVALLREEQLDAAQGAVEAWRAVLEVDETDREALRELERLHAREGAWEDLLGVLDQSARFADDAQQQLAIKHRKGEVLVEQLEDLERAIEAYRDALDLDPGDPRALDALERIYRQREDWPSVHEIAVRRLEAAEEVDRIPIYFQLADLCVDRLDAREEAVGYLRQVLDREPRHGEAFSRLERLLRANEQWYDLVDLLRRKAELAAEADDAEGEVQQLLAVARLWTERLDNPDAAAEVLERVLERDERNVGALAELARLYEATEQWDRCRETLERAAQLGPQPSEAAELAYRMGRVVAEQGGSPEEVAAHYERALGQDSGHLEAAEALEQLARDEGQWERVAQLLELRIAASKEPERQLALLCDLGAIHGDKLGQPGDSLGAWERACALAPDDPAVLAPLAQAYCEAGRLDDAEPLLLKLIEAAGGRRSKQLARYHYLLGIVAEQREDSAAALGHYEKSYRIDSTHGPTLVALGRSYIAGEDWKKAQRIYRSMLLQNADESWGISRAEIFGQLGKIHAALGEPRKARSMLERGLELAPDHPGLKKALAELG